MVVISVILFFIHISITKFHLIGSYIVSSIVYYFLKKRKINNKEFIKIMILSLGIIILSILIVYLFNIIVGLLPIIKIVSKTPASILARKDVD